MKSHRKSFISHDPLLSHKDSIYQRTKTRQESTWLFINCLKQDESSAVRLWPHLASLNTYYLLNVPYHSISTFETKSDQPQASNHFKEPGLH